jgi:hypothetical protein
MRPDSRSRSSTGVGRRGRGRGLRVACSFLTARALTATACMRWTDDASSSARQNSIVAEHIPDRGRAVECNRGLRVGEATEMMTMRCDLKNGGSVRRRVGRDGKQRTREVSCDLRCRKAWMRLQVHWLTVPQPTPVLTSADMS